MKFIKLTRSDGGSPVYVDPAAVVAVSESLDDMSTVVHMSATGFYVAEDLETVLAKLDESALRERDA
jgi:hypothetical protein